MKKVAWILVSGALVAACGSGTPAPADTGVSPADTGASPDDADTVITLADGGGSDAATTCGFWTSPSETSIAAIPASCMPRCSAATRDRAFDCPPNDEACLAQALWEDTTPTISISSDDGDFSLGCMFCFQQQFYHCVSLGCPAQAFAMYTSCSSANADQCMRDQADVDTCAAGLPDAVRSTVGQCLNEQQSACFDTGGGLLPGGARPPAPQPPAHRRDVRSLRFGR